MYIYVFSKAVCSLLNFRNKNKNEKEKGMMNIFPRKRKRGLLVCVCEYFVCHYIYYIYINHAQMIVKWKLFSMYMCSITICITSPNYPSIYNTLHIIPTL